MTSLHVKSIFIVKWIWRKRQNRGKIDIFVVNGIMAFQLSWLFLILWNFHFVVPRKKIMRQARWRRWIKFINRSIVRFLWLSSWFVLLCLTTIHHNINRKISSFSSTRQRFSKFSILNLHPSDGEFAHGEKFEYLLICLKERLAKIYSWDSRCHVKYCRYKLLFGRVFIC